MKLSDSDPHISDLITQETKRQTEVLQMIPSENYASQAVREAVGSVLMNKYSEGLPHKRYYQGNSVIDEIEDLCKTRALKAFGLNSDTWDVNVQAHSGCEANLSVINGLLAPGEKILSMYLPDGGHLSHGWYLPDRKVTLTSKVWNVDFYHVDKISRLFDYEQIRKQALKFKPKLLISGGTAYPREIKHKSMGEIAKEIGAYYLADISHEAGLVVGGANASPFPYAHVVTMTTHKTLRGPRGALIFARKIIDGRNISDEINASVFPGIQGGPHNHTIAGIAVALKEASQAQFKAYAEQVVENAKTLADIFSKAGLDVVSGGTDKHLVLLDLRTVGASAWIVAWALEYAGIVMNRNTVPNDTGSPYYPSGLRMGTPSVTSRGMKTKEMKIIGDWILQVITSVSHYRIPAEKAQRQEFLKTIHKELNQNNTLKAIARSVRELCKKYPTP